MMIGKRHLLGAILGFMAAMPALADDIGSLPATAGGHAHAKVVHAIRKDGALKVELRFVTDYASYSGETLYDGLDAANADEMIWVEAGGRRYPLSRDTSGTPEAPAALELTFNYDPARNPRVAKWEGVFEAPPAGLDEAELVLPNVAGIGPFRIRDR
ncbi:hypothetical protein JMM61_19935 [Rhodovulum sulfidophilum]|uniref:hypothetical protein n=1 Tax=Rhodovulum sulfidophilum TaxID=35806 RepID=UPI001926B4AA|nr:hypothetical protein [Rhodovulum sulfidophilum]MBL3587591.1 hypothetical protein [Rhodovulum sulfidophilum]